MAISLPRCPFYRKCCSLIAPCCHERVCCHRCHDKEHHHRLPRQQLQWVVCNKCGSMQSLLEGSDCQHCGTQFASYFCQDCGIANSDVPSEGYFHCEACSICRVGRKADYFHCFGCGCCLKQEYKGNHICRKAALDSPCPICLQGPMFDSQQAAHKLPCGHMAHKACIDAAACPLDSICTACNSGPSCSGGLGRGSSTTSSSSRLWVSPGQSSNATAAAAAAGTSASGPGTWARPGGRSSHGRTANVGFGTGDSSKRTDSGCSAGSSATIKDVMDLMGCIASGPEAAGTEQMLQELVDEGQLLLRREVKLHLLSSTSSQTDVSMCSAPKRFRQALEAAIVNNLLLSQPEITAKGAVVDAVVRLLHRVGSSGDLAVAGQAVSFDRVAVVGSVAKGSAVRDQFDVDLVAFFNVPDSAAGSPVDINIFDPNQTHDSDWMQQLLQDTCELLDKQLPATTSLQFASPPRVGKTAITFSVQVQVAGAEEPVQLDMDVLLAPNLLSGAGKAAADSAAKYADGYKDLIHLRRTTGGDNQCAAVLTPILKLADAAASRPGSISSNSNADTMVQPAYIRSVWLAESATRFMHQAGEALCAQGVSTRVVAATVRLVKAWVRKGLQPHNPGYKQLRSFMLELLVLHAAQKLAKKMQQQHAEQEQFAGRYVLDLLLVVLKVAQDWASRAAPSSSARSTAVVTFTELAGCKYTQQQALALQRLARQGLWRQHEGLFSKQPVVLHPVDPLCNISDQDAPHRFCMWAELGQEAGRLLTQLQTKTWGKILQSSTLGAVLRV